MAAATTEKGEPLPRVWPEGVVGCPEGPTWAGTTPQVGKGDSGRKIWPQAGLASVAAEWYCCAPCASSGNHFPREYVLLHFNKDLQKTFFTLEVVTEINRKRDLFRQFNTILGMC